MCEQHQEGSGFVFYISKCVKTGEAAQTLLYVLFCAILIQPSFLFDCNDCDTVKCLALITLELHKAQKYYLRHNPQY